MTLLLGLGINFSLKKVLDVRGNGKSECIKSLIVNSYNRSLVK